MDQQTILMHPEGSSGVWVFRFSAPNIGDITRGEVSVPMSTGGEDVSPDLQKAAAIQKIQDLVHALAEAAKRL